jgi:predicted lipid-binding transport protein (Tim44 family)
VKRRTLIAALIVLAALAFAPAALAAAGGGSSGFGGGGGGGGGGGHGGSGFVLYILFQLLFRIALLGHGLGFLFLVVCGLIYLAFRRMAPGASGGMSGFVQALGSAGRPARRTVATRERRVELAAAEAAEDDPAFAPDNVRAMAAGLYVAIQGAWDAGDRVRLRGLVATGLLVEWERRLDDLEARGWHNRVQPLEPPTIEYVGLTHKSLPEQDRIVVRIEARLRDYVVDRQGNHLRRAGRATETVRTREYWTLGRRGERWILLSIEQGAEGSHALRDQVVATPWSDDNTLRDEALLEAAVAEAVPEGTKVSEVADLQFDGDARAAALDLSLADGRFAPDVLEIAARRATAAWAEAVDGSDAALLKLATPAAAREMLHPGDPSEKTRLVVRGPVVRQIRIAGLDAGAEPPTMTIDVELEGRRYLEDRDTAAIVAGSQQRATKFTERWTLALDGPAEQPWRIAAVGAPVGHA